MKRSPKGIALITGLLFLIIVTLLGVALMRNYGLQGRMAGNFREKGRSFESAQAALQYAEWWLSQGNVPTALSCSSLVSSATVCSNAISNPTTLPWTVGVNYTPSGMSTSGGSSGFSTNPQFYIQYLGVNAVNGGNVYRITSVGYGGNAQAATVLQSTYVVASSFTNRGR